jgi:hypothetical protein
MLMLIRTVLLSLGGLLLVSGARMRIAGDSVSQVHAASKVIPFFLL